MDEELKAFIQNLCDEMEINRDSLRYVKLKNGTQFFAELADFEEIIKDLEDDGTISAEEPDSVQFDLSSDILEEEIPIPSEEDIANIEVFFYPIEIKEVPVIDMDGEFSTERLYVPLVPYTDDVCQPFYKEDIQTCSRLTDWFAKEYLIGVSTYYFGAEVREVRQTEETEHRPVKQLGNVIDFSSYFSLRKQNKF